jgi:23S rRNA (cytosine1962-C5)-methyltransferase
MENLRLDLLGPVLWEYWYGTEEPSERDHERMDFLATYLRREFHSRKMQNRGQDPLSKTNWSSMAAPTSWVAHENQMKFHLHSDRGLSPGLFLDQRNNRDFVIRHSQGLRVLNLFAYTGGFSVAAALGGAKEVVTVDVSRDFLQWTRENFTLNELNPEKFEFFKQDVLLFLKGSIKRQRQFDLIICDPPTFGRSKDAVFSLEKDFVELVKGCEDSLAPGGTLIFSCNLERWSEEDLRKKMTKASRLNAIKGPSPCWDFEKPDQPRLMKTLLLRK